jgi:UDP-3-O-[3-hydroxymyristoyl] glucosamine N-acyltransferase
MTSLLLSEIIEKLDLEPINNINASQEILGLCGSTSAEENHLTYAINLKNLNAANLSDAAAVIVPPKLKELAIKTLSTTILCHPDPQYCFSKLAALFSPTRAWESDTNNQQINATYISGTATIGDNVYIGYGSVVQDHVVIESGAYIGSNVTLERGCKIGSNSRIQGNNYIGDRVQMGKNCWIHPGAVIGTEGFGFTNQQGKWERIPHLGSVIIGDNVEIGANTAIDRGAVNSTIIADNVILDNQIHIAHNVTIGSGTAIAGCVGIAGSTDIGEFCLIGGGTCIGDHIKVADKTKINGMSLVYQSLTESGEYASGMPVMERKHWNKTIATLRKLIKK